MGDITDVPSVSRAKAAGSRDESRWSNKLAKICSSTQSLNANEPLCSPTWGSHQEFQVGGGGEKGTRKSHPLSKTQKDPEWTRLSEMLLHLNQEYPVPVSFVDKNWIVYIFCTFGKELSMQRWTSLTRKSLTEGKISESLLIKETGKELSDAFEKTFFFD